MKRAVIALLAATAMMAIVCLVGTQIRSDQAGAAAPDPDFDYVAAVRSRFLLCSFNRLMKTINIYYGG